MEEIEWTLIIMALLFVFMAAVLLGVKNYELVISCIKGLFEVVIL